jgi:hypothetical protein
MEKLVIDDQRGKQSKQLLICTACVMKGSSVLFTERIYVGFSSIIGSRDYLHDIYQCRMYSGKLLVMGRGTARNM